MSVYHRLSVHFVGMVRLFGPLAADQRAYSQQIKAGIPRKVLRPPGRKGSSPRDKPIHTRFSDDTIRLGIPPFPPRPPFPSRPFYILGQEETGYNSRGIGDSFLFLLSREHFLLFFLMFVPLL